jgi:type VI secretion system protein ImpC
MQDTDSPLEAVFTLESSKTGVIEEPPFRMLVMGDWIGDVETRPLDGRSPIEIDRDNFDEVLERLGVRLRIDTDDGNEIDLEFHSLDDFHPDHIFERVPEFAELRRMRKLLNSEETFYEAAREVRERFSAAEVSEQQAADEPDPVQPEGLLESILEQPTGSAAKRTKPAGELGSLISELVRPYLVTVNDSERSGYVSAVDNATGSLMRLILHDKKFQQLEAAWRGLYFLIRRTETASDLKISILQAAQTELSDDLKSSETLANTFLYKHVIRDTLEIPNGEPWAAMIGNYSFHSEIEDIATLIRISKIAAVANAPFISHVRPEFLGIQSIAEKPDPQQWDTKGESDAGKLWSALMRQGESSYLAATIPRFLARLPYGADTDPLESFHFEEFDGAVDHDNYVWSNAAFIAGQLLAAGYSSNGWQMSGSIPQDVEGLPTHVYKEGSETIFKPCGEVLLTENAVEHLLELGLMPLVSFKNTDRVRLARFQSVAIKPLKGMWQ